jgi:VanZ family protein
VTGATRYLALLAAASAAFTFVGSLVPFEFRDRPGAVRAFTWAMAHPFAGVSKSDAVVNVLLGVPLGFALLGAACGSRQIPARRAVLRGLLLLPGCVVFSAAVEFTQLYTPARFCSGFDVLAQTLGAVLGMGGWLIGGPWLVAEVGKAVGGTGTAHRFLIAYTLFLAFVQALPLDFSASPADAYRKFRDGGVKPIPFGEFRTLTGDDATKRVATLLQLGGLYLPLGLLAAAVPGRFWHRDNFGRVLFAGCAFAAAVELGQVLVRSRTTSTTDVLVGGAAAFLGWAIGKTFRDGLSPHAQFFLGAAWWTALVWVSWSPFAVEPGAVVPFDWTPGGPLEGGNPLFALEAMLTKIVLFGLGGALVAGSGFLAWKAGETRTGVLAPVAVLGLLGSGVLEFGQTRFVGHSPCVTDVLLGGLGAYCGAWATGKIRVPGGPGRTVPPTGEGATA